MEFQEDKSSVIFEDQQLKVGKDNKNDISQTKGNGIDVEEFNDRREGGFVINVMPVKEHANSLGILSREMRNRKRGRDCRLD